MSFAKSVKCAFVTAVLIGVIAPQAHTQQPAAKPPEVADKIIAIVGDSIVLKSDIDLAMQQARQQGQPIPDSAAMFKSILERTIGELVLLQAAARDTSIKITQDKIESEVTKELDARRRQFDTEAQFQQALQQSGLTVAALRSSIEASIAGRILLREFVQKLSRDRKPPPVTDEDIKRYFEANKTTFGVRPASITFAQIVLAPRASDSARATARAKADSILKQLQNGADFETLAKQVSEDPSTRDKGGDLGWFRSGSMVKEFDQAVFSMLPGQISAPIESSFGFHIIKLERVKGAERNARHILIVPTVGADDADSARARATRILEQVKAGASMDSLIKSVGDLNETPHVGPFPRERLPAPYNTALATAATGDFVGPLELPGVTGTPKYAIIKVTDTKPSGEYALSDPDFRAQLRDTLQQNALVDELIRDYRKRTLVEYR